MERKRSYTALGIQAWQTLSLILAEEQGLYKNNTGLYLLIHSALYTNILGALVWFTIIYNNVSVTHFHNLPL